MKPPAYPAMRILAVLFLLFALPGEPAAHSMLLSSEPADGAVVEAGPSRIELRFNEPVVPVALRVIDATGATLHGPGSALRSDDGRVTFELPAPLANGQYVVSYRVVSADTHPVAGSIAFAVGTAIGETVDDEIADPSLERRWSRIARINRFLRDLLLAVGCGGLFFVAWLAPVQGRALRPALAFAAVLAAVATIAGVGISGARVALAPSLLDASVWRIGASTSAGISALAILAGVALAALKQRVAVVAGLVVVAVGTALTGHAATGEPRWLVPLVQATHSFAALVWVGAFAPLLWGCARWSGDVLAQTARGFSRVGITSVAVLFAAGLILTASRVSLPDGLTATDYGLLVAMKGVLFVAMLALAADNRLRAASGKHLVRNVALELALAIVALAVTANLSHTPPHTPAEHAGHAVVAPAGPSVALVRDGRVLFLAINGRILDLHFGDGAGATFDPLEVEIVLISEANGIAGLRRAARRVGAGHYRVEEPSLAIEGLWRIEVGALVTDFRKDMYAAELRVGPRKR